MTGDRGGMNLCSKCQLPISQKKQLLFDYVIISAEINVFKCKFQKSQANHNNIDKIQLCIRGWSDMMSLPSRGEGNSQIVNIFFQGGRGDRPIADLGG